jgi:hypothetical protein
LSRDVLILKPSLWKQLIWNFSSSIRYCTSPLEWTGKTFSEHLVVTNDHPVIRPFEN